MKKASLVMTSALFLLAGAGCAKNDVQINGSLETVEPELNTPILQDLETTDVQPPTVRTTDTRTVDTTTREPELNTPILRDNDPEQIAQNAAYFFLVKNKDEYFGTDSEYGVLMIRKNCNTFAPIYLAKHQPLHLALYLNKPIVFQQYELQGTAYVLKQIAEDEVSKTELDTFKKTCSAPFETYME